ncbi:MAG: hypothetical protein FD123_2688 [Bacteroidetes bacterium]|nr:MAG: hypothetical protein FD123_2688 [Bacteroidota bacterium]
MKNMIVHARYESLIFEFRGQKIMIDSDLAILYGISTKSLKQQVKRNKNRFPQDFMFVLTKKEKMELVTNCDRLAALKHSSVMPLAFTEQGVAMLSSILRSPRAVNVNIEIMRAFVRFRALLKEHVELRKEIADLDEKIEKIFSFLLEKINGQEKKRSRRRQIGYKITGNKL